MSTGFGKYLNENSCPVQCTIWAVPLQVGCWVFQVGGRLQTEGWSCFLAADSPTLPRRWGGLRGTEIQEVSAWGEWAKNGDRGRGSPGTVREEPWAGWGLGSLAPWPLPLTWPEPSPGPEWTSKASGRLGPWTLESVASFPSSWDLSCRLVWCSAQSLGFFEEVEYPEALRSMGFWNVPWVEVFWHFISSAFCEMSGSYVLWPQIMKTVCVGREGTTEIYWRKNY